MKFNKIAACFAAAACSVSMLSVMSVSAADTFSIKAGSASPTKAGEVFTLDIELAGVPSSGVAGLDFGIKYDSTVFQVTDISEGAVSKTTDKQIEGFSSNLETNKEDGKISVLWATGQISTNSSWIKTDGVLLTLTCKALKEGTSSVEIVPGSRAGATSVDAAVEGLKIVNPAAVKGTVEVGKKADIMYGDITGDKVIDLSDLIKLSQYLLKDITLTDTQLKVADCDGNGEVDITDLPLLRQYIMLDQVTLGPKK